MNPRTPISELELSGSPNLLRAKKRAQAEGEGLPLAEEVQNEVAAINELIAKAISACRRGQTVNGKRNPSFSHLATLIKMRKLLLEGKVDPKQQTADDILAEANKLLGVN